MSFPFRQASPQQPHIAGAAERHQGPGDEQSSDARGNEVWISRSALLA
jgi:hypothetical protein